MDFNNFKQQISREVHEYLADLREIREDLSHAEGWIALGLLVMAVLVGVTWAIVSLGFNPPNDQISRFMYRFGLRTCRPIDNFGGVIVFVDFIMLIFLTVISLGNVINLMKRANQKLPREPRDLIISTSLMLVVGLGGIIFMLRIC